MPFSPSRYRLTHIQRFVLDVLRSNPQISYDGMAEQAEIDRQTAMQAIRRLTRSYRVVKLDGRGRLPNRYLMTDRVITCPPGYRPKPVLLTAEKRAILVEQWQRRRLALIRTSEEPQAERQVGDIEAPIVKGGDGTWSRATPAAAPV